MGTCIWRWLLFSLLCLVLSACPAQRPGPSPLVANPAGIDRLPASAPVPVASAEPVSQSVTVTPSSPLASPLPGSQPEHTPVPASSVASGIQFGSSGNTSSGGSGHAPWAPVLPSGPQFQIQDVVLSETGQSILGAAAPAAIQPDYIADLAISITLRGRFDTVPVLNLAQMRLTHAPGLLHLSLLANELPVRLTLNQQIVLTPLAVSATEIVALLRSRAVPDLYLKGLHTLTLTAGTQVTERQIKVGDPLTAASLNPAITQVEILNPQSPVQLKLTGQHLMLQPGHNYIQINGLPAVSYQTAVRQTEGGLQWETLVHWPAAEDFELAQTYDLLLSTPFGVTMTRFGQEGN